MQWEMLCDHCQVWIAKSFDDKFLVLKACLQLWRVVLIWIKVMSLTFFINMNYKWLSVAMPLVQRVEFFPSLLTENN